MKKLLLLLCLVLCSCFVFADDYADEYDDYDDYDSGYEYKINARGDQFMKVSLMPFFPLNFEGKLYVGGGVEIGYYRFINSWFALGGEINFSFNITIGTNTLVTLPGLFGVIFQPTVGKFEFPVMFGVGIAFESSQNTNYFPGFAMKADVGVFYRIVEAWSFGLSCKFYWLPEWFSDPKYNVNALFLAPALSARYHF